MPRGKEERERAGVPPGALLNWRLFGQQSTLPEGPGGGFVRFLSLSHTRERAWGNPIRNGTPYGYAIMARSARALRIWKESTLAARGNGEIEIRRDLQRKNSSQDTHDRRISRLLCLCARRFFFEDRRGLFNESAGGSRVTVRETPPRFFAWLCTFSAAWRAAKKGGSRGVFLLLFLRFPSFSRASAS